MDHARVGDEQQLVVRAARLGPEALRIGRLVKRRDGDGHSLSHPRGEQVRCHEDVVVALIHLGRGQVRVADLPQEVDLAAVGRRLLEPEQVDGDVVAGRCGGGPVGQEVDPRRVTGALE